MLDDHKYLTCDCLDLLRSLPDDSIDMVLVDPPYGIRYDTEWDCFASEDEYLSWCQQWTLEAQRVLKPGRMMCVFGTLKTDAFLRYKLEVLNKTDLTSQNEIVWSYNWGGRGKTNFARKHEYVWCYSKGEDFIFNGDDVRIERKQKRNVRTGELFTNGTIPTCVWEKNNHTTSREYVKWHPTQKPLMILERMIRAYTNPGDVVLDFFAGSGSTMLACEETDRRFIGSDLSADYTVRSFMRFLDYFDQVRWASRT